MNPERTGTATILKRKQIDPKPTPARSGTRRRETSNLIHHNGEGILQLLQHLRASHDIFIAELANTLALYGLVKRDLGGRPADVAGVTRQQAQKLLSAVGALLLPVGVGRRGTNVGQVGPTSGEKVVIFGTEFLSTR